MKRYASNPVPPPAVPVARRIFWLALVAATVAAGAARGAQLELSTGFDITNGKYGETQSTTIATETLKAKYRAEDWSAWVTLPYLQSTGPDNVVPGLGAIDTVAPSPSVVSREGVGDVVLGARGQVWSLPATGTSVDLQGKIRVGTAPASRGLGTGSNNYYLEVEGTQPIAPGAELFAAIGRRFTDSPPSSGLRDVWYGSVGGTYRMPPAYTVNLWLDMREPASAGSGPQQEVTLSLVYRPVSAWKFEVYATKGFAAGSPAVGGGGVVTRVIPF